MTIFYMTTLRTNLHTHYSKRPPDSLRSQTSHQWPVAKCCYLTNFPLTRILTKFLFIEETFSSFDVTRKSSRAHIFINGFAVIAGKNDNFLQDHIRMEADRGVGAASSLTRPQTGRRRSTR